jgi:hypothetical protein
MENQFLMEKYNKPTLMIDIKKIIKEEGHIRKFQGIAPDGFILVHENTLEQLKDMNVWLEWKMERLSIEEMNKINFDNT